MLNSIYVVVITVLELEKNWYNREAQPNELKTALQVQNYLTQACKGLYPPPAAFLP